MFVGPVHSSSMASTPKTLIRFSKPLSARWSGVIRNCGQFVLITNGVSAESALDSPTALTLIVPGPKQVQILSGRGPMFPKASAAVVVQRFVSS